MNQAAGQCQFLLHATGEFASQALSELTQARKMQQLRNALIFLGGRDAMQIGKEIHIFLHGHIRRQNKLLGNITRALANRIDLV